MSAGIPRSCPSSPSCCRRSPPPVTIINGRHDRVVPVANAEFLDERLPNSRVVLIDAGHFVWEEAPAEYAATILDSIGRHRSDHIPKPTPAVCSAAGWDAPSFRHRRRGLAGRGTECARLDQVLADARRRAERRAGASRLRRGIGKSAPPGVRRRARGRLPCAPRHSAWNGRWNLPFASRAAVVRGAARRPRPAA